MENKTEKDNLLNTMMEKRQRSAKKVMPGNLLDVLFNRRKHEEDAYKKIMDEEQ